MASSLAEDLVCPICLSLFQDPHMLSCGHNFCLACLQGCLSLGAQGAPCPECRLPFQMRDLVRNRALANVARKVRRLERDQGLGALPGEGDFCEEHDEPLKLFCLQDRLPICVICRDLPRHRRHRFLPTKDAVQDAQGKLKPYLKVLKKNLASITRDESLQEKEIATLESLTEDILKDISKGFEVLHQTLHEKEQSFKNIVQEMKEENLKEMKTALASLEEDRASQAETLSNIKAALVTTDHIAFLKGKLKPYLKRLKKNLASITRDESLQEKEITTLESLTEDILKDISKGFEVLHQTLHEKEQSFKNIVQEMKEENLKEMKTALASLEEDRASQAETLSNIKAALVTTDHIAFLKDFKNLMDKVQKYPLEEEDKGESSSDEEEASNKNREHSDQEEARNDEEEGDGDELEEDDDELEEDGDELEEDGDELEEDGDELEEDGDEREYEIEEFGDEKEEEEDEGNVVLVDPALEEFKDNMDFEAWKEMLLQEIMAGTENEEEATDDEPVD